MVVRKFRGDLVIEKNDKAGFRIDLQLKDLKLANEAAYESGVSLPGLALVQSYIFTIKSS